MDPAWYGNGTKPINNISGIYGYWTLSSSSDYSAFYVGCEGQAYSYDYLYGGGDVGVNYTDTVGIRPVITLKLK